MKTPSELLYFGLDNDPPEKGEFLRNNPDYWSCTNCGKVKPKTLFSRRETQTYVLRCYDRFEESERRIREAGEFT